MRSARRELRAQIAALEQRAAALEAQLRLRPALWNVLGVGTEPALPPIRTQVEALTAEGKSWEELLGATIAKWFTGSTHGEALGRLSSQEVWQCVLDDRSPIPAPNDRERYFETDDLAYWLSGLADALVIAQIAQDRGRPLSPGQSLLDFGCASGRVLRQLATLEPSMSLYGADIGVRNVVWAREHLPAEISVHQTSLFPHLPFPDASIDVIYAGSVFTHIDELEEATLLELRRILHPDGFALITFHPEREWRALCTEPDHWVASLILGEPHRLDPPGETVTRGLLSRLSGDMPAPRMVFTRLAGEINSANVYHSREWLQERWGRHFAIEEIVERAHGTHQDAIVLARA